MDLIYADGKRNDIGVLLDYQLDLAYGKNENNFECSVCTTNHVCRENYVLYIENTEYGGIIDGIRVDTDDQTVVYIGRTWHGVLEGKVLEPDAGEDYLTLSGEANQVLSYIIDRIGLQELFLVSEKDSGIIVDYKLRYGKAYSVICDMLFQSMGKLKLSYKTNHVEISAEFLHDYSMDEEWDSSQIDFRIEKNYRPVNHLVCLGKGDLKDRHVIHLFTDENGGIQPYKKILNPLEDSDYILDKSKQVLFGEKEVSDIYDYPNAQATENYVIMLNKPSDWDTLFANYYKKGEDKFENITGNQETVYMLQDYKPYDWENNYKDYFLKKSDNYEDLSNYSEEVYTPLTEKPSDWLFQYTSYFYWSIADRKYHNVEGVDFKEYCLLDSKPPLWDATYDTYFYYWSDGVNIEYKKVQGEKKDTYVLQTTKPTDWKSNFKNYYKKLCKYFCTYRIYNKINGKWSSVKEFTSIEKNLAYKNNKEKVELVSTTVLGYSYNNLDGKKAPEWKAKKYYTKQSVDVAPKYEQGKYYYESSGKFAPEFSYSKDDPLKCYYKKTIKNVPDWTEGRYYTKAEIEVPPEWISGKYYEKKTDNFAVIVEEGIKKLKESFNCDKIEAEFNPEQKYDIGDIVGANENVTQIAAWQPITKKIVKIKKGIETIEYKVGE